MQYGFVDGLQICVFWLENGPDIATAMVMVILFYTFFFILYYTFVYVFEVSLYIYICIIVITYRHITRSMGRRGSIKFRARGISAICYLRVFRAPFLYDTVVRQFLRLYHPRYTRKILNKVCSSFGSERNE